MAKGREQIITSAIDSFSQDAFENIAISQICKKAKVSNGLFYKHFKNKEELFKHLLEETSIRINNYFQKVTGDSVREKLISFIEINYELTKKEIKLIKVYREGQYKFIEYEKVLREVYLKALEGIFGRRLDAYEYSYAMSGIRYINVNFVTRGINIDSEYIADTILNGMFNNSQVLVEEYKSMDLYLRVLFNSENFKHKLLAEGEKLFGSKGIYDTKIHDIASLTGGGVGSFYYYYKTKDEFVCEVGKNIINTLIYFLKDNCNDLQDDTLVNRHVFILFLMLEYYQKSPYKYQVIRELEFINIDIYYGYVNKLEKYYIKKLMDLNVSDSQKHITANILIGISHYMGLDFFFLKNLDNKEEFLKKISKYMTGGLSYILTE